MKRKISYGVIAASVALAGTMAAAPAAALDVKPGLWETTSRSQAHGQLPIPQAELQKMTPQQRAALAKMEARNKQPRAMVFKGCLTKEKLEKDENAFLSGRPGMKCTSKLSRHTGTSIAGSRRCTKGSSEQTEHFAFEVRDREHVTGTVSVTISDGGRTMSSKGNLSSRWISASCGNTR